MMVQITLRRSPFFNSIRCSNLVEIPSVAPTAPTLRSASFPLCVRMAPPARLSFFRLAPRLSSDNYKFPRRQLKLPIDADCNLGLKMIPPTPLGDGRGEVPFGGFRGKQLGSSCLSSAGFGAAAPCVLRVYSGSGLGAFSPAFFIRWLAPSNSRMIE